MASSASTTTLRPTNAHGIFRLHYKVHQQHLISSSGWSLVHKGIVKYNTATIVNRRHRKSKIKRNKRSKHTKSKVKIKTACRSLTMGPLHGALVPLQWPSSTCYSHGVSLLLFIINIGSSIPSLQNSKKSHLN